MQAEHASTAAEHNNHVRSTAQWHSDGQVRGGVQARLSTAAWRWRSVGAVSAYARQKGQTRVLAQILKRLKN